MASNLYVDAFPEQQGWFVMRKISELISEKISGPWSNKLEAETRMAALENPKASPALRAALGKVSHSYVLPEPAYYVRVDSMKRHRLRRTKCDFATPLYTQRQVEEMLDAAYGRKHA